MTRDAYYALSILLRYYKREISEIVDLEMLKDIIVRLDGHGMGKLFLMKEEFAMRMVRLSMNSCIDAMLRQKSRLDEILKFGYLGKLELLLKQIEKKLQLLIFDKKSLKESTDHGTE